MMVKDASIVQKLTGMGLQTPADDAESMFSNEYSSSKKRASNWKLIESHRNTNKSFKALSVKSSQKGSSKKDAVSDDVKKQR